jgi:AcrR family transcriptional regulator
MTSEVQAKVANAGRVAERHAHLVNVASDLFLRQGFHQTSVREIAAAAGWQMPTLYRYIARKEDVLYLISSAAMDDVWGGLEALETSGSAAERLRQAATYFFEAVARRRREIKLLYRESASLGEEHLTLIEATELKERDYFAAIIEDGIRTGEFAPVDVPVIAHDLIMLAHMWALKGWALRPETEFPEYMKVQLDLVFRTLTAG